MPANNAIEVLGAALGSTAKGDAQFADRLRKLTELQCGIADIDDPGVKLTLGRMCANVSKVSYLLWVSGTGLSRA